MAEGEEIYSGEVHVDGNWIVYAGPAPGTEQKRDIVWEEEIDCKNNLLMRDLKMPIRIPP